MAYINVAEWSSDQVTEWLKGLDNTMYQYTHSFTNNGVSGKQLLNIRPYELEQLGIKLIGHQEIILEAVEYLKNFHYNLEKENLQYLAMQVSTSSRILYRQLHEHQDQYLPTQTLKDITRLITQIKALIRWLDHTSFTAQHYKELRSNLLKLCLEIATSSQRDRFMEHPVDHIRQCALKLTEISDFTIIMEDPLVIQPSSLELVTLKKRENDVGFLLMNSMNSGIQRITGIKFNSPAYHSGKIEDGDEIVQINYQTVVGWNDKRVIALLNDSPPDVLMTLKTKPKHNKIYGQIYIKPYRLPSKKRSLGYRWGDLPSPRDFFPSNDVPLKKIVSDSESSSSEIMTPTDDKPLDKEMRLYMPKPRAVLQRRHSISGDQYNSFKSSSSNWFFNEAKNYSNNNDSPSLRDKSVSFGFGLELTTRPTTCLGIGAGNGAAGHSNNTDSVLNGSLPEMMTSDKKLSAEKKPGISKVVRFESTVKLEEQHVDTKYTCNVDNTVLETFEPIPYVDEEEKALEPEPVVVSEVPQVEAPNVVVINREVVRRGKLDKSFSTPAYGSDNDSDTPPAIEPRKEHLQKIPPVPPPRPRKLPPPRLPCPSSSMFVKPQPASSPHECNEDKNKSKMANVIDLKAKKDPLPSPFFPETPPSRPAAPLAKPRNDDVLAEPIASDLSDCGQLTPPCTSVSSPATAKQSQVRKIPATKHFLDEPFELEMAAPLKNKTLTLKKKNSLLAKRRLVSLKALDTNDIQGHLYRRAKNRHGSTFWARYYFVLVEYVLYGFRTKDSPKADFLIFLSGFTVSLAKEVHSKPFAFKVYHPSKSFYFAAETSAALAQWMEYIKQAAMKGGAKTNTNTTNLKELFSETDSSDDDFDFSGGGTMKKHWATPSPSSGGGNGGGGGSDADSVSSVPVATTKADSGGGYHLKFGSLKKFAKSSLAFSHGGHDSSGSSTNIASSPSESKFLGLFSSSKNQAERKVSSDIPQPTSQFRSYRRGGGAAIGGGGSGALVFSPNLFTNHQNLENYPPVERSNSIASSERSLVLPPPPTAALPPPPPATVLPPPPSAASSVAAIVEKLESIQSPPVPAERTPKPVFTTQDDEIVHRNIKSNLQHIDEIRKSYKTSPHNYIHASNPNLVEFDFPTAKAIDFSTKIHSHNNWDVPFDTSKKFTLKDLMLQKQREEAQDMYNKRVFRGVEKTDDTLKKKMNRPESNEHVHQGETANGDDTKISKIQKRSLPITPDYAQSFKPDDQDILYTRSREGQKLRDFGYELISGDDNQQQQKPETSASWSAKRNDRVVPGGSTKKKSFNWMNSSSSEDKAAAASSSSVRSGSFKKVKSKPMSKFDNLKASSEKIFQFKSGASTNDKDAYNKSRQADKVGTSSLAQWSSSLKGSNAILDDAAAQPFQHGSCKSNSMRKNSAPERVSYFSKISFQSHKSVPKDKTLLGSPRLHRALFGRTASHDHQHNNSNNSFGTDHEIFSPVVFPCKNKSEQFNQSQPLPLHHQQSSVSSNKMNNSVDYGALQLPPVFEPETYSLSDPSTSMTLLKRRHNNQANKQ